MLRSIWKKITVKAGVASIVAFNTAGTVKTYAPLALK